MLDFEELMDEARLDIHASLDSWKHVLLTHFGSSIEYITAKGSALKPWDSSIDYVPVLSDVDIHVKLKGDTATLADNLTFVQAIAISKKFETEFLKMRSNSLHIPRTQIVDVNRLRQLITYIPPRKEDLAVIFGSLNLPECPSSEEIRRIDRQNLLELEDILSPLPLRNLDRTGLDYWSQLRQLCYRISPTPVRLITQWHPDPIEVWSWNRTRIVKELRKEKLLSIAKHYSGFYNAGWELFLSDFKNNESFRSTLLHGFHLLSKSLTKLKALQR